MLLNEHAIVSAVLECKYNKNSRDCPEHFIKNRVYIIVEIALMPIRFVKPWPDWNVPNTIVTHSGHFDIRIKMRVIN